MKGRVIVLDTPKDRAFAAALMVDGRLEDLLLSPPKGSALPEAGDIAVVRVKRKLPKAGAFCEMAGGIDGYLRDAKSVREGERVLVQVASLPEPGKAVALTTRVLFKGPRLILTPGAPGVNVSRQIGNQAERARLQEAVQAALESVRSEAGDTSPATALGVIVRSAARGEEPEALARELEGLLASQAGSLDQLKSSDPLSGGHGGDPLSHALREWVHPKPDAILCNPALAKALASAEAPDSPHRFYGDAAMLAKLRPEDDPFEASGAHDAMAELTAPETTLSGGRMTVEATRALVAVDVDTGSDFSPAAGLKANLAAAAELPRQLRLRGLGGQVAVDFAPMPKQHRKRLEEVLAKAFRADPVETSLVGWTKLGLFELQRKRERRPLAEIWSP